MYEYVGIMIVLNFPFPQEIVNVVMFILLNSSQGALNEKYFLFLLFVT